MVSREGKYPPSEDLAKLIRHWNATWPAARISGDEMKQLYPYILQKWREGWTLAQIAQTACSCNDGRNIAPSPAALRVVPARRLSLPPVGAVPGQTFGAEEIRDAGSVSRLKMQADVAELKAKSIGAEIEILFRRMQVAPESGRARLEEQRQKLVAQLEGQKQAAEKARARLAELESTGRLSAAGRKRKAKKEPVPKAKPPTPKPARQKRPAMADKPVSAPPAQAPAPTTPTSSVDAVEDAIAKLYEDD